jgi:hypothetical protein
MEVGGRFHVPASLTPVPSGLDTGWIPGPCYCPCPKLDSVCSYKNVFLSNVKFTKSCRMVGYKVKLRLSLCLTKHRATKT